MSVKEGAGAPINPANLWGKPDPRAAARAKEEEKVSRKIADEEHLDDEDIDVESVLDEADVDEEVVHAEVADDVGDEEGDDDEDFDPEEGDEEEDDAGDADAELEDDTTASTEDEVVDDDDTPAANSKSAATSRKRDMSAKKTSLSDHIRSEIARRQEAGDSLRGKDIVAALASRRVTVSPAQVSQILKKEGLGGQPRGRKPKAAVVADGERSRTALKTKRQEPKKVAGIVRAAPKVGKASANGFHVPMDQLQAAETFVAACGGSFQSAERILTAAAQLSATFSG